MEIGRVKIEGFRPIELRDLSDPDVVAQIWADARTSAIKSLARRRRRHMLLNGTKHV